jgi:arylsulfatase A-like enzyme
MARRSTNTTAGATYPYMYDELLRVPLVVDEPGREPSTNDTQVSLIDVPPTVCDACGVARPAAFQGESLFEKTGGTELATAQGGQRLAARTSDWKLLWHVTEGSVELYDLGDDPEETTDVSDSHPEVVDRLRGKLREYRETARDTETELPEVEESAAVKRRLRDLGYTE